MKHFYDTCDYLYAEKKPVPSGNFDKRLVVQSGIFVREGNNADVMQNLLNVAFDSFETDDHTLSEWRAMILGSIAVVESADGRMSDEAAARLEGLRFMLGDAEQCENAQP